MKLTLKSSPANKMIKYASSSLVLLSLLVCMLLCTPFQAWGEQEPGEEYLAKTMECQWDENDPNDELVLLAQSLDNDPVKIYHWVYNNIYCPRIKYADMLLITTIGTYYDPGIRFFYKGSRLGARGTYWAKRGNRWDTSSLLVTLLRISGIPARYARFTDNDLVYVEAWMPLSQSRGISGNDESGWVPLAPWFKTYEYEDGIDLFPNKTIPQDLDFDFDEYLSDVKVKSAIEVFEEKIQDYLDENHPGKTLKDVPFKERLIKRTSSILPASLPFDSVMHMDGKLATETYAEVPDEERIFINFYIKKKDGTSTIDLLSKKIYLPEISGKRLCLDFNESSGQLFPVLKLEDQDDYYAEGTSGLNAGEKFFPAFEGGGYDYTPRPEKKAGTFMMIGFDSIGASESLIEKTKKELHDLSSNLALSTVTQNEYLGRMGFILLQSFLDRSYDGETRSADLMYARPAWGGLAPTFIYTYPDTMRTDEESKFFLHPVWNIDAFSKTDLYKRYNNKISFVPWFSGSNELDEFASYNRKLHGYQASLNESFIFEDWMDTPALSTIKGIMLANEQNLEILTITQVSQLSDLAYYNSIGEKEQQAVANIQREIGLGSTVITPSEFISYEGMSGYVYIAHGTDHDSYAFDMENGGQNSLLVDYDLSISLYSDIEDSISVDEILWQDQISILDSESQSVTLVTDELEPLSSLERALSLVGDPVDLATGEFYQEENPDVQIKSLGFDLSVRRKYLSKLIYNGPFGYGWSWNHGQRLMFLDSNSNGTIDDIVYFNDEFRAYYLTSNGDGTYQYPPGTTFVLTSSGGQYIVTLKNGDKQIFDSEGYLVRKEDTNGNYLTFEYDTNNRMTAIRDSLNRALTFTYNANDKVARVTDFTGRYCDYAYDGDDLISFTDLEGNTTEYEYLSDQENPLNDHNMSKYILPNGDYLEIGYYKNDQVSYHRNKLGQTFNFQYSRLNRYGETWNEAGYYRKVFFNESNDVIRVDNEDGTLETKTWDANHNMLTHTDANGHTTAYTYDGRRNVLTKTNALNQQWTYTYHATFNKVATETDPKGYVTTYTYDTSGNLTSKTDPAGKVTGFTHDSHGNLIVVTDPLNHTVTNTYDAQGLHIETVTDKNGNETDFTYDSIGRIATVTDPEGFATEVAYNDYGQKTLITDALFNETIFEYDVNRKPVKRIDPSGAVTALEYHPARDIVAGAKVFKKTDALGNSEYYDYDELGNLIRKEDRNGNATTYAYDPMNRLIEETDAFNNTVRYTYDGNGNLTSKTDRRGNTTSFTYDKANRKTSMTDAGGNTTAYAYDANGNLTDETNAIGMVTHYVYDNRNLLTEKTAGYGTAGALTTVYAYDDLRRKIRETFPLGNYTVFGYDSNGNQVRVARYDRYDNLISETLFEYDGRNLLTKKTDAEGNEFIYQYDELGRKIAEIDPRGNRTEFFYDTMGNLVSVTDDLGNATWHSYDLNNRRVKTENALGHVTGYRYDNVGNQAAVIDAMGQRTNFWYDALNRKIGRQDPAGGTTVFDYDENGNLSGTTDPAGSTTLYAYDADNRRTSEIRVLADSSETETVTQYDELGRVETVTDRTGTETEFGYDDVLNLKNSVTRAYGTADETTTLFGYDDNGRLDEKIEAYGTVGEAITEYKYDDADNLTDIINANGETVTYTYDLLGRRLREYDADGSYLRAEYDGAGNMTLVVKRDGTQIVSTFDDLNRKTAVTVNGTPAQSFAFDALSRMVQAVDRNEGRATNTAAWEYDALNRVTAEVQNCLRVEKGYDDNSNLEVLAYPGGKVVERTFNADNTLYEVWDGTGTIAINQYYAHGVPAQVSLGNGILLSLTQDDEDKETGRDYTLSGTSVYSMATVWDFRDNVAQETENRGGADTVKDFAYDNLDQLTSETAGAQQTIWQYDDVGNWVSTNQNGTAEDRTVNADNEYNYITGMNPAHDANGNLVSDGTRNYVFDWANRLTEVWSGGQKIAEYTYDATNKRVSKYLPASSEAFTFVYNDGQVIEEYLNSSLARTYTYGAYIDDPLMVEYGGQRYFYAKDRRYNVTALTDAVGAIVERYEYSAFGRMTIFDAAGQDITATGSTIGNPYGFTGRRFDTETGLWYYRNRMYSPALGRFLQRDPAGYVDGINLYAYVQNNPVRFLDPHGLQSLEQFSLNPKPAFQNFSFHPEPVSFALNVDFDFDKDLNTGPEPILLAAPGINDSYQYAGLYNAANNYKGGYQDLGRLISPSGGVPPGVTPSPIPWGEYADDFSNWVRGNAVAAGNAMFPKDDRPASIKIQDAIQFQLRAGGIGQYPGELVRYSPPPPQFQIVLSLAVDTTAQAAAVHLAKEYISPVVGGVLSAINWATIIFDPMPPPAGDPTDMYFPPPNNDRPCK